MPVSTIYEFFNIVAAYIQLIPASSIAFTIFWPFRISLPTIFFASILKLSTILLSITATTISLSPLPIIFLFFMALGSICVSSFIIKPSESSRFNHRSGYTLIRHCHDCTGVALTAATAVVKEICTTTERPYNTVQSNEQLNESLLSTGKLSRRLLKKSKAKLSRSSSNSNSNSPSNLNQNQLAELNQVTRNQEDEYTPLRPLNWTLTSSLDAFNLWLGDSDETSAITLEWLQPHNQSVLESQHQQHQQKQQLGSAELTKHHYTCPPTSLEALRQRYGRRTSLWGEWSSQQTRHFYRTQLPTALQSECHCVCITYM